MKYASFVGNGEGPNGADVLRFRLDNAGSGRYNVFLMGSGGTLCCEPEGDGLDLPGVRDYVGKVLETVKTEGRNGAGVSAEFSLVTDLTDLPDMARRTLIQQLRAAG